MKRLGSWIAGVITLVLSGAGMLALADTPEQLAKWRVMLGWIPAGMRDALAIAASWVLAGAILLAAVWMVMVIAGAIHASIPRLFIAFSAMRRVLGMGKWITRAEALAMIEASDFFAIRTQPQARELGGIALHWMKQLRTRKETILHDRFRDRILSNFEAQRRGAVGEEGYQQADLSEWLNALVEAEVDSEMGDIPHV